MEPDSSFTFTASSDRNLDAFPSNKSSNFSNELGRNINLKKFDVALSALYWHDNYLASNDSTEIGLPLQKLNLPFYNIENRDHEISILEHLVQTVSFSKKIDTLLHMYTSFNSEFRTRMPVHLSPIFNKSVLVSFELDYSSIEDYTFVLPPDLAKIFGFSQHAFRPGKYKSDLELSDEELDKYPKKTTWTATREKWASFTVDLDQLYDPILSDITSGIVTAIIKSKTKFRLSMLVDDEHAAIKCTLRPDNAVLILSPFLNDYFGLEKHFRIEGSMNILVKRQIVDPFDPRNVDCDETTCTLDAMASECNESKSGLLKDNPDFVIPLKRMKQRRKLKSKRVVRRKVLKGGRKKKRRTVKKKLVEGGRRTRAKKATKVIKRRRKN
ncbi:unnamed protein product [Orchesella dallaii]|uniref:Uncharacterized protein n=1 Tax=Orchesella dallaii TaxID=48710 RepID=A0ABP1RZM0_9HEXA